MALKSGTFFEHGKYFSSSQLSLGHPMKLHLNCFDIFTLTVPTIYINEDSLSCMRRSLKGLCAKRFYSLVRGAC